MTMSVILPPPEIRIIVEKLAAYVIKNGPSFEDKIFQKERQNPRFSFLYPNDPYHAYYQKKISEFKDAGLVGVDAFLQQSKSTEASSKNDTTVPPMAQTKASAHANPSTDEAALTSTSADAPKNVASLEFLLPLPTISALDYDVVKLTAQFVARNGRQFMLRLGQREARNAQFDFLKPHHSLHAIFLRLVEQYTKILLPSAELLERISRYSNDRTIVLANAMDRLEYAREARNRMRREEAEVEAERQAFAAIDWNDFAVLETVEFAGVERTAELPRPLDLATMGSMSIVQRQQLWSSNTFAGLGLNALQGSATTANSAKAAEPEEEEQAMEMEMDEDETAQHGSPCHAEEAYATKRPAEAPPSVMPSGIRIRQDYVPKAAAIRTNSAGAFASEICPLCQQAIPKEQIEEHLRIEALDPKWHQQREAYLAKHRGTNLVASGVDVVRNLEALSRVRELTDPQLDQAIKTTVAGHVQWDGRVQSVSQTTREAMQKTKAELQAQMAALEQQQSNQGRK